MQGATSSAVAAVYTPHHIDDDIEEIGDDTPQQVEDAQVVDLVGDDDAEEEQYEEELQQLHTERPRQLKNNIEESPGDDEMQDNEGHRDDEEEAEEVEELPRVIRETPPSPKGRPPAAVPSNKRQLSSSGSASSSPSTSGVPRGGRLRSGSPSNAAAAETPTRSMGQMNLQTPPPRAGVLSSSSAMLASNRRPMSLQAEYERQEEMDNAAQPEYAGPVEYKQSPEREEVKQLKLNWISTLKKSTEIFMRTMELPDQRITSKMIQDICVTSANVHSMYTVREANKAVTDPDELDWLMKESDRTDFNPPLRSFDYGRAFAVIEPRLLKAYGLQKFTFAMTHGYMLYYLMGLDSATQRFFQASRFFHYYRENIEMFLHHFKIPTPETFDINFGIHLIVFLFRPPPGKPAGEIVLKVRAMGIPSYTYYTKPAV